MRVRYAGFDAALAARLADFQQLLRLFHQLLITLNGDVDRVLEVMKDLQGRRYIPPGVDLEQFRRDLEKRELIQPSSSGAGFRLTARGERGIRQDSLDRIFSGLKPGAMGNHALPHTGGAGDSLPETRPYVFGDALTDLDPLASTHNALRRGGIDDIAFLEEDLEVREKEVAASCATVLMLDISHSMILYGEDRITPAKRVALALAELIETKYPKDALDVVVFGDEAWQIPLERLPYAGVGPYHTNTAAGLQLAQKLLRRRKHANRQIFMITDGKPSALTENGRLYLNSSGLDPRIVSATLREAAVCRRNGIPVTTFMVAEDPYLTQFVREFTQVNEGRAYYASLDNLGQYLFEDFVKNRKRMVR